MKTTEGGFFLFACLFYLLPRQAPLVLRHIIVFLHQIIFHIFKVMMYHIAEVVFDEYSVGFISHWRPPFGNQYILAPSQGRLEQPTAQTSQPLDTIHHRIHFKKPKCVLKLMQGKGRNRDNMASINHVTCAEQRADLKESPRFGFYGFGPPPPVHRRFSTTAGSLPSCQDVLCQAKLSHTLPNQAKS